MKKIITTFLLSGIFIFSAMAQPIFEEDFENGLPVSFITIDGDGKTPHSNVPVTFDDPWEILAFNNDPSDEFAASNSWYDPAGQANDWLITSSIMLTDSNNFLYWNARSADPNALESYQVLISTTGTDTSDFTVLTTINGESSAWNNRNIYLSLAGYINQPVYIAFRHISNDKFILAIDDIVVKQELPLDLKLSSINKKVRYTQNQAVTITSTVVNNGINPITSFDLNWTADNGATINTYSLSGLNINSASTMALSHPDKFTTGNAGSKANLKVWISNINSGTDGNSTNDTLSRFIYSSSAATVNKKVLLEEFTTVVCQYCPDGATKVEEAVAQNSEIIPIGVHSGFGTDAMTIAEAETYAIFTNGAPTAMVNRKHFIGENDVAFSRATQVDTNLWKTRANAEAATGAPVSVDIRGTYTSNNRTANITISSNFVDYPLFEDVRLTLFIIEDSVTGTGFYYDQINAYYNNSNYPEWYQVGRFVPSSTYSFYPYDHYSIPGYVHRHVLRDVYPTDDAWGNASTFPAEIVLNNSYDQSYTLTLDNNWDEDQVKLVAFVSYYDEENLSNREILNVTSVDIQEMWGVGIEEQAAAKVGMEVYPNPFKQETNVGFELKEANEVNIQLYDVAGKLMLEKNLGMLSSGKYMENLQVGNLESGFYFVRLNVGNQTATKKVSLLK